MRAYRTFRFIDAPDVADLRADARPSKSGVRIAPRVKAATRRALKRADKARAARLDA